MTLNNDIIKKTGSSNQYPDIKKLKTEGVTEALMIAKRQLKHYPLEKRRFFEGYIDLLCKQIKKLKEIEQW